jgi:hypothetical protein
MTPDTIFPIGNLTVLAGWLALMLSPLAPRLAQAVAGTLIPVVLSLAYAALVLAFWADADGGFATLAQVMQLFTNPTIALAGWLHYLAFDLLVGAWITRKARAEGVGHLFVLPCLGLTFLFGPIGFLAYSAIRATRRLQDRMTGAAA